MLIFAVFREILKLGLKIMAIWSSRNFRKLRENFATIAKIFSKFSLASEMDGLAIVLRYRTKYAQCFHFFFFYILY